MDPARDHADDRLLRLSEYMDGALDPAARSELEEALARDEVLRDELAAYRKVDELVRRHGAALPEMDWERFIHQARRRREAYEKSRGRSVVLRWRRPLAAAAAIAIAVTATFVWRSTAPQQEVPTIGARRAVTALVTVGRAAAGEGASVAVVNVFRTLPGDTVATVGPVPRGRTLIVAVAGGGTGFDEEEAGLVF